MAYDQIKLVLPGIHPGFTHQTPWLNDIPTPQPFGDLITARRPSPWPSTGGQKQMPPLAGVPCSHIRAMHACAARLSRANRHSRRICCRLLMLPHHTQSSELEGNSPSMQRYTAKSAHRGQLPQQQSSTISGLITVLYPAGFHHIITLSKPIFIPIPL